MKKMKGRSPIIVTLILYTVILMSTSCKNTLVQQGDELIEKVEKFKTERGRLPGSLSEIGITETEAGPLYYDKTDSSNYIIWFGTELGESKTYHSDSKKWE
jgi:hypothetical protein